MNFFHALFKTSLGKKYLMAGTGIVLVGYIIGHLYGNLQIFSEPEKINGYAHFLQSQGWLLWVVRLFLLAVVGTHIWAAVKLTIENRAARKVSYREKKFQRASYASRTMHYSGVIVAIFLVYHILHFTVRSTHGEGYYPKTMLADGTVVPDVHAMMVVGFQQPLISMFYLIGVGLLSWHLSHGLSSMFQSLGLRSRSWSGFLEKAAVVFSVVYFLGNAAIVLAVWTGLIDTQNPDVVSAEPEAVVEQAFGALSKNTPLQESL